MDDLMKFLDGLAEKGWMFSLSTLNNEVTLLLCLPEWVTDNLYQSVPLPSFKGKTIKSVVKMAEIAVNDWLRSERT